ncbi:MAG: hypothetical protein LZ168_06785 [Thaumarchaeota archaeon]|jgi:hypothetical protein|nr:hypothetical protein [Candidatus Geocrenenecus arthurdayi]
MESQNKLWENNIHIWEELKNLRMSQEKLWEEVKILREEQNKLLENYEKM